MEDATNPEVRDSFGRVLTPHRETRALSVRLGTEFTRDSP